MHFLYINWEPALEAFHIGSFGVRWYSLLWCVGLLAAYLIVKRLYKQQGIPEEKYEPLFLYCFVGVLIGARLGHCIFYEPEYFLTSTKGVIEMFLPIRFAQDSWDWRFIGYTGLASHGGTIGLFLAILMYARKMKIRLMTVLDNIAIATPAVAGCIRLGNLMNSEIIGTPTSLPWGFIFHTNDALVGGQLAARHPAQLYEALWYFLMFFVIWRIYKSPESRVQSPEMVQEFKGSRVQGFKGSRVQEFKGSRVQEFKGSRVQEFKGSRVQEFKGSRVQEFKGSRVQEFKGSRVQGFKGSRAQNRKTAKPQNRKTVGSGFYFGFTLTTIFLFRFFVEFIKAEQVDFERGMMLDMGQLLSIPFVLIGIYFMLKSRKYEGK